MSRAARKLRQAKKLAQRMKMKAAKKARFAAAQERRQKAKAKKKGKWRGLHREPVRNRRRGNTVSFKVFCRQMRKRDKQMRKRDNE